MSHGGAREGSGRKPKYEGQPKTKPMRVPVEVPPRLVDSWIFICIEVKNAGYNIDSMSVPDIVKTHQQITKH